MARPMIQHVQMVFDLKAASAKAAEILRMEEQLPELHDAAKEAKEKAETAPEWKALWLVKQQINERRAELLMDDEAMGELKAKHRKAVKAWKESGAAADLANAKDAAKTCEAAIRAESRRLAQALVNAAK